MSEVPSRVLITGAGGYIGSQLGRRLAETASVLGIDLRAPQDAGFAIECMDIRDPALTSLLKQHRISHVVHLAAVLEDSGDRARDYDIDVNGTRNVVQACVAAGVTHLTVSSSGAAYGYHPDNPEWLSETDPLRGNPEFAYSDHKRLVEELLQDYAEQHPALKQLVLRVGTVLGANTSNLITALFARKRLIAVRGSDSPFVAIWDQDLLAIIEQGVKTSASGVFNVAGDGALSMREIASILNKPLLDLPAWLLKSALAVGKLSGLGRYGPAQVNFLRYRPVLSNTRLKREFAYTPEKTTREVFEHFIAHARQRGAL